MAFDRLNAASFYLPALLLALAVLAVDEAVVRILRRKARGKLWSWLWVAAVALAAIPAGFLVVTGLLLPGLQYWSDGSLAARHGQTDDLCDADEKRDQGVELRIKNRPNPDRQPTGHANEASSCQEGDSRVSRLGAGVVIIPFERKPNLGLRRISMPIEEHECATSRFRD